MSDSELKCSFEVENRFNIELKEVLIEADKNPEGWRHKCKMDAINKFKIDGDFVYIKGIGYDGRCSLCQHFRELLVDKAAKNGEKIIFNMWNCIFKEDSRHDYTPETMKKKNELKKMLQEINKTSRNF
jgi:hypothetical protein